MTMPPTKSLFVGQMSPSLAVDLLPRLINHIETTYGFLVRFQTLEAPRTGIFDGLSITIDPHVTVEEQCFLLLHLFGHSVQWVAPSLTPAIAGIRENDDFEAYLRCLHEYEMQAARFGMQVLCEIDGSCDEFIDVLVPWFEDSVESDWQYVERWYRTKELRMEPVKAPRSTILPLPIPTLQLKTVEVRFAF